MLQIVTRLQTGLRA